MKKLISLILLLTMTLSFGIVVKADDGTVLHECLASEAALIEVTDDVTAFHFAGPQSDNTAEKLPDGTAAPQYIILKNFSADKRNFITMRYFGGSSKGQLKDFSQYDKYNTYLEICMNAKKLLTNTKYKSVYLGLASASSAENGWCDQIIAVDIAKYIEDTSLEAENNYYNIRMSLSYIENNGVLINSKTIDSKEEYESMGGTNWDAVSWGRYRVISDEDTVAFDWSRIWGISFGVVTAEDVKGDWSDEVYFSNPKFVRYEPKQEPFTVSANQTENVDPAQGITLTFSQPITEDTLLDAFTFYNDGKKVSGKVTASKVDNYNYRIHSTGLRGETTYTLEIAETLKDINNQSIEASSISFTTMVSEYGWKVNPTVLANVTFDEGEYLLGESINGVGGWTAVQRECDSATVETDPDNSENRVLAVTIDNTNTTDFNVDYYGARYSFNDAETDGMISISYRVKIKNSGSSFARQWADRIGFVLGRNEVDTWNGMHLMGNGTETKMYFNGKLKNGDNLSNKMYNCGDIHSGWIGINALVNPKDYSVKLTATQMDKAGNKAAEHEAGEGGKNPVIYGENGDYYMTSVTDNPITNLSEIAFSIAPAVRYSAASDEAGTSTLYVDDVKVNIIPFLTAEAAFDTAAADAEKPIEIKFNNKIMSNLKNAISLVDGNNNEFPGDIDVNMSEDGKTAYITAEGDLKFDCDYTLTIDASKGVTDEYGCRLLENVIIPFKTRYSNYAYINGFTNVTKSEAEIAVSFSLKNASDISRSPFVAIAAYDENGYMTGIIFKNYSSIAKGESYDDTLEIKNISGTVSVLRAFVWESSTNLTLRQRPYTYYIN